jgi:hypothetical protein
MPQLIATSARHYFIKRNNSATSIGQPAAGGTLTIYNAGTTTQADTWFDRAGGTNKLNTKPILLDDQGSCVVWLEAGKVYDWIAKDELGNTIDDTKGITGTGSSVVTPSQWIEFDGTPTYVNTRTFTVTGNQTSIFQAGRRVQINMSNTTVFATVISSSYSTLTTVALGFQNSTDIIDPSIGTVFYGFEPTVNPALAIGSGSIIDLTGYAGADVALDIGQMAVYDVVAATTHLLRIATGNNQEYKIMVRPTFLGGAAGVNSTFQPNNANTAAAAVSRGVIYGQNAAPLSAQATNNAFVLDSGGRVYRIDADCCTRTNGKTVKSIFRCSNVSDNFEGIEIDTWNDTTTPWSSLGTLNFANAITGRIAVKREM